MKNLKLFLDDEEEEDLEVGLLRLSKSLPSHEFFFEINRRNLGLKFKRIKDLNKAGRTRDYYHSRFETYHAESKACIQVISNASIQSVEKPHTPELFSEEVDVNYLLPSHPEVDYLIKRSDALNDFSVILWPENIMFPIQLFTISPTDGLFDLIQYYE